MKAYTRLPKPLPIPSPTIVVEMSMEEAALLQIAFTALRAKHGVMSWPVEDMAAEIRTALIVAGRE